MQHWHEVQTQRNTCAYLTHRGDKRKRGGSKNALVAVAAVLGVALIVTSWGAWSSRSAVATAKRDLAKLRNEVKEAEASGPCNRSKHPHVNGPTAVQR